MAYCDYTGVQQDFKTIVFASESDSPTSLVTQESVTQMIVEADALINSYVGSRYVVPITGAMSLSLMSLFSRTLVADRVRGILANKQQTNTDANQQVKSDGFSTRDVMKALNDIKDGISTLIDAVLNNPDGVFYSNNFSGNVQGTFKKSTRQW